MVEFEGAWPEGFRDGTVDACPSGTVRHANGGGCATANTPDSVYVGSYAKMLCDLEAYSSKSNNIFYGLVDDNWDGVSNVDEVTVKPPYYWRP